MIVERGFGILKVQWRCLLKCLDANIENVSSVIIICVVLYNIFQFTGDNYVDDNNIFKKVLNREQHIRNQRGNNNRNPGLNTNNIRLLVENHFP